MSSDGEFLQGETKSCKLEPYRCLSAALKNAVRLVSCSPVQEVVLKEGLVAVYRRYNADVCFLHQ